MRICLRCPALARKGSPARRSKPEHKKGPRRTASSSGSAMMADAGWERVCCEIVLGCPLLRRLLLRGW